MELWPDSLNEIGLRMIDVSKIHPAAYNPRRIEPSKSQQLRDSIQFVGFGKPIILNSDGTIIAGHQRTTAARSIGLITLPAFVMHNVSEEDEVRFNQIHNSSDIDATVEVSVQLSSIEGFCVVGPSTISYDHLPLGANARSMIHLLFMRHGQFSGCIACKDGEVISGHQYAVAMKTMNRPLLVYYISNEKKEKAIKFLSDTYGEFSYSHLKKNTYVQSFAQKFRLRSDSHSRSTLYERFVIPEITRKDKIFDFGCGQADYLKRLARLGYDIGGLEFYYRTGNSINIKAVDKMVDHLLDVITLRRYDVVICDSVLNSVDTVEAERDVVVVCNALLRKGGKLYISGRRWEFIEGLKRNRKQKDIKHRNVEFLDGNGFSALFRAGEWFYQKFHTREMAKNVITSCGFEIVHHEEYVGKSSWQIVAKKVYEMPGDEMLKSIEREFSLPLPNGKHKYGPRALETFKKVYEYATNNPVY
jgi:ParB family chromosome partitioning protein